MLEVRDLTIEFGDLTIVDNVSFSLGKGQWIMLAGPNGAGKSSIVSAISRDIPYRGQILMDNKDIAKIKPGELAKNMGVLTQHHHVAYSYTVEEIVKLGRYAYSMGLFSNSSEEDNEKVELALELTGLSQIRHQSVLTLSGGELQRTFLAQLFAQNPRLLILDEPANHLDLVYQKQVFELIGTWIEETKCAVISVVHDLSFAKAYGMKTILLNKGRVIASGDTENVLNRQNLKEVYDMDVYEWMQDLLGQWEK